MRKDPEQCPRCGEPWEGSDEDSERCASCFDPRIPPEWPEEDKGDARQIHEEPSE